MKISVTQADIDAGIPGSCGKCPIALAVRRNFPDAPRVFVEYYTVSFRGYDLSLPRDATRFIDRFDRDEPVTPFDFEFSIPAQ